MEEIIDIDTIDRSNTNSTISIDHEILRILTIFSITINQMTELRNIDKATPKIDQNKYQSIPQIEKVRWLVMRNKVEWLLSSRWINKSRNIVVRNLAIFSKIRIWYKISLIQTFKSIKITKMKKTHRRCKIYHIAILKIQKR